MSKRLQLLALASGLGAFAPARAAEIGDADIVAVTVGKVASSGEVTVLSDAEITRGFSRAACACDTQLTVGVSLTADAVARAQSNGAGVLGLYVGDSCATTSSGASPCRRVGEIGYPDVREKVSFATQPASALLSTDGASCSEAEIHPSIWILADENGTGSSFTAQKQLTLHYDGAPPASPDDVQADSGDQAIELHFNVASDHAADLDGFQILCATYQGQTPVFPAGKFSPSYDSASGCGEGALAPVLPGAADPGFLAADPKFLCSGKLAASARTGRVDALTNDVEYQFAVIAIDKAGNASALDSARVEVATPAPTQGAADRYRDAGGSATGGFCAIAPHARAASSLVPALLAALCALAGRRLR
jgi:hypothetical protein